MNEVIGDRCVHDTASAMSVISVYMRADDLASKRVF